MHISKISQISKTQKKIAAIALITLVLCVISAVSGEEKLLEDGKLMRPDIKDGQLFMNITAFDEGGMDCSFDIAVNPRKFTRDEIFQNFAKAQEYLTDNITGENSSFDKISSDLKLITSIPEYGVSVDWYSSDYEIIGYDGTVFTENIPNGGENIKLTAIMKCGEYEAEYEYDVKAVKPEYTGKEKFSDDVCRAVNDALEKNEYEDEVMLPKDVSGYKIRYSQRKENNIPLIAAGGIFAAVAAVLAEKENQKKSERLRKKDLQYAYSEVVSTLTLLIGAGMSVQRAWEKIVSDYEKKRGENICFAYEEMLTTFRQIQSGVPEKTAYREFGRRCDTKEYRKLGTLLEQNVRKGTKGLSELLEQESAEAFEQRKNLARQLGEEAGTKLLLPMILMLVIVMVIVMVPAVMSFQI